MSERKSLTQLNAEATQVAGTIDHVHNIVAERAKEAFPLDLTSPTLEGLLSQANQIGSSRAEFIEGVTTESLPRLLEIDKEKKVQLESAKNESYQAVVTLKELGILTDKQSGVLQLGIEKGIVEPSQLFVHVENMANPFKENSKLFHALKFLISCGNAINSTELAVEVYEQDLSENKMSLQDAVIRTQQWILPTILHTSLPTGSILKTRDRRKVLYEFVEGAKPGVENSKRVREVKADYSILSDINLLRSVPKSIFSIENSQIRKTYDYFLSCAEQHKTPDINDLSMILGGKTDKYALSIAYNLRRNLYIKCQVFNNGGEESQSPPKSRRENQLIDVLKRLSSAENPITQSVIAEEMGINRMHLNTLLAKLKERGDVRIESRRLPEGVQSKIKGYWLNENSSKIDVPSEDQDQRNPYEYNSRKYQILKCILESDIPLNSHDIGSIIYAREIESGGITIQLASKRTADFLPRIATDPLLMGKIEKNRDKGTIRYRYNGTISGNETVKSLINTNSPSKDSEAYLLTLTKREREVYDLLTLASSNDAITTAAMATELEVDIQNIHVILSTLRKKLPEGLINRKRKANNRNGLWIETIEPQSPYAKPIAREITQTVETPTPTEKKRLKTFIIHLDTQEVEVDGQRKAIRDEREWEVLMAFANNSSAQNLRNLGTSSGKRGPRERYYTDASFRNLLGRFEKDPRKPEIFFINHRYNYSEYEIKAKIIIAEK